MSYGFTEPEKETQTPSQQEPTVEVNNRKSKAVKATFDPQHRAKVKASNCTLYFQLLSFLQI